MIVASLPDDGAAARLGPPPEGVRTIVWDGHGRVSDADAAALEFFVARYNAPPPPAEVFAALPSLRVVQVLSVGVDAWLPVVPDGVRLCNARGVHDSTTAELAVAGMLAVLRGVPGFVGAQAERRWQQHAGDTVSGRRVLLVGAGDIAQRVAQAVRAFDATVTFVGRTARAGVHGFAELPELLPAADVVVLAVPLTGQTIGMVDRRFLAALPDHALLVNVARGPVVDTEALLAELRAGRLRAFLDVTDPEPLPADHPLWTAPNVLITPHVGGGTRGWTDRAYRLVGDQLRRYAAGQELANRIDGGY